MKIETEAIRNNKIRQYAIRNPILKHWEIGRHFKLSIMTISRVLSTIKEQPISDTISMQGEGTYNYACTKPDCYFCKALDF